MKVAVRTFFRVPALLTGGVATFGLLQLLFFTAASHATVATDFNAGRIIEDSVFTNNLSMNPQQILSFLQSKVPACDTWGTQPSEFGGGTRAQWGTAHGHPPPYTCLKDYNEGGRNAAQIIYDTAQQYAINPQVFIVLLQKEQGLVTDTWPLDTQYRTATGYGCPDTAPCDSQYYGLTNQLNWSGKMFRAILNNSSTWYSPYILGNNSIQWSPNGACGSSTVYIENRSTQALYDYTPYRPNQAALNAGYGTGDSCSSYGNRNFYLYFRDWFGYNSGPAAFKTAASSTIYVPVDGYKMTVPYMAAMQDYGISADSIQTVDQSYIDARPTPTQDTGFSTAISHIVKSPNDSDEDGGSVYLISRGMRYQFQTVQQIYDFGFTEQDISYLPLSYILSKPNGGTLPYFVTSPYGSVFKVDSGKKRVIFEYSTYIAQNPADTVGRLSYYLADKITSGTPLVDHPILLQMSQGNGVNLYANNNYYSIATYNTFSCWGLDSTQRIPTYRLPQDNYIQPITVTAPLPGCLINDGTSTKALNQSSQIPVSQSSGVTGSTVDATLLSIVNNLPVRQASLSQYVKPAGGAGVNLITNGTRQVIPTYTSFLLLGIQPSNIDVVSPGILDSLNDGGIKLANGQLVKTNDAPGVFTIANGERVLYSSSDNFLAYGNNWGAIASFPSTQLDQNYPYQNHVVTNYLVDKQHSLAYVIANNGCFTLSSTDLNRYGTSLSALTSAQSYDIDSMRNVNLNCSPATAFIKQPYNSLVYWVSGGQKQALTTYSAMLAKNNGTNPTVMVVGQDFIQNLPTAP